MMYVHQLPAKEQDRLEKAVRKSLKAEGLTGQELKDAVETAMDSRVCDLQSLLRGA